MDATTFYRWERKAKEGMREALAGRRAKNGKRQAREIERLEAELEKKRRIIAEVVGENLELKRGSEACFEEAIQRGREARGAEAGGVRRRVRAGRCVGS